MCVYSHMFNICQYDKYRNNMPLNNVGVRDTDLPCSQKFVYKKKKKDLFITIVCPPQNEFPTMLLTLEKRRFELYRSIEKSPLTSGPMQFKPVLFKGQLYMFKYIQTYFNYIPSVWDLPFHSS